jgi:error-prone DNA polymerase
MNAVVDFPQRKAAPPADPPPLPPYAEFAVTTNFSFLRGASHPEELVLQAKAHGLAGLGIADRNSVAGVVRAHVMAKEHGLRLAVGARLVFADGTPDILAYPCARAAWGRLTRLLSHGKRRAEKGGCILHLPDLIEHAEGLNLIVMPPARIEMRALSALLATLKRHGTERALWLGAGVLYRGDDRRRIARLAAIAAENAVPLIATNDVLYHAPERRMLQDVVTCIREHVTLDQAGRRLLPNAERHLKPPQEMARLFAAHPDALWQTQRLLERCPFSLDEMQHDYPHESETQTPQQRLVALTEAGLRRRFPDGAAPHVRDILDNELRVIGDLGYAPFFLTVHDIMQFARSLPQPILCQGRGSAANSMICYCLGITEVGPKVIDPLFERFISRDRGEPPDIDVDFEHQRREEVIQHIYDKYGRDHAGLAATVICYRGRSAVREVGKVFGLSEDVTAALASTLWGWSMDGVSEKDTRRAGLDPADPRLRLTLQLSEALHGFPRHLSQHVGGFVITRTRLDEVVPIENAAMADRTVIEWDKEDLESLGLLKVDVLGLGMLTCLRRGFDLLRAHYGIARDLSEQDEDEATYRMIHRADTIGVFQIESRAQMSMLPRLKPKEFYDLVIEVAIVRPGPIQGKMVHPYLQRRAAPPGTIVYPAPAPPHPQDELKDVLSKTLGVPLFQEQAMRIAIVAAGFRPAEADKLRRAMATFKRVGTIGTFQRKMIEGMTAKGYARDFAERCFEQIKGFGEYGFPESHAASFANLVYASAWLKCHYPDVFAAALLNSQPMGFYAPAQIVRCAQEHGVAVRPVDINASDWDCTLEPSLPPQAQRSGGEGSGVGGSPFPQFAPHPDAHFVHVDPPHHADARGEGKRLHPRHADMEGDIKTTHALRLGLRQIGGLAEEDGRRIAALRGRGYDSIRDLWLRTGLKPTVLETLARADAFGSLGLDRRTALWCVRALRRTGDKDDLPLFARVAMPEKEPDVTLPPLLPGEQVVADYRHLRLSLKAHPVSFLRADLDRDGILANGRLAQLPTGRRVSIAGVVLIRQRPGTAKGVIFMTLEDETGIANAIVWPKAFETFRPVVLGARLVGVTGRLQNEKGVVHVVAERIDDLTALLRRLSAPGEDDRAGDPVPQPDAPAHPRRGDSLVRLLRERPEQAEELMATHAVMPKGRNFH